jgi:ubiquinone/menaquinone biosynthesis C-methylase UbiE
LSEKAKFGDFRDVDRAGQPEKLVGYLDTVTGMQAIQAYKLRSYDMLHLRPGFHVLDVGCGTGDDVRAMVSRVLPSGRVVGVDNSQIMINEAQKRSTSLGLPVEFRTGDVTGLPFDNGVFDATRADRVFQHLADPEKALHEMIRVTRPGGTVGVLDPDWETLVVDSPNKPVTRQIVSAHQDTTSNPWSGRQLYSLYHKAHLQDIEVLAVNIPILTFALSDSVLNLRSSVDRAVEKSAISVEEGSRWLRHLEDQDRAGHFFSSVSGFGLFGTKAAGETVIKKQLLPSS